MPAEWKLEKKACATENAGPSKEASANVWDLFRRPHTCGKTIILYCNWFINSLTYYGLTLNPSEFAGDFHANFMINGALEVPAYAISMVIIR